VQLMRNALGVPVPQLDRYMDTLIARGRALMLVGGGILWIYFGGVLALRPPRVPGISFRASTDVLPWLGVGLLLVAVGVGAIHQPGTSGPLWRWARRGMLAGAALYALGHTARLYLAGAWEPAVPFGFLTTIVCLILLGVSLFREHVGLRRIGVSVVVSGLCLLLFNDQYQTAWAAVPFGVLWVLLGLYLLRLTPPAALRHGV
jgi:hypothetical protein